MSDTATMHALLMAPVRLSALAGLLGLQLHGPDRDITSFGTLDAARGGREHLLTYAVSRSYIERFVASDLGACVISVEDADRLPAGASALLTGESPADAFLTLFARTVDARRWEQLPARRGVGSLVARSAKIHDHVQLGDHCRIMENVVLLPNTCLGDRVVVQPNATVGGDGFQVGMVDGKRSLVPHVGGVLVGDDVTIGSQTCIDRGLFGEFTSIGAETMVDNLVHIAHAARIGDAATVVACAEISGSVEVGDRAWLGPNSSINPGLKVGHDALVGTGSTVVRDVPPHAIAYGNPARIGGWRCNCGTKLSVDAAEAHCMACGMKYALASGHPVAFV